ncbi:MAG: TlpA disulfide reductase family protein [Myxococcota bacterium]|nr:TlpA disulfide reductase family protein [Myxococcota bacterium]
MPARRLLLAFCSAAALLLVAPATGSALEAGDAAPEFQAPKLGGGSISLSDYRGKVVYLDFWASWCPPCRTAMPVIDSLRAEFPPERFQVVAVNVDREESAALKALRKQPVGYPSAADPKGQLPARYEVGTMPTSYLIDGQGVVRYVHEGFRKGDGDALRREIRALLAQED